MHLLDLLDFVLECFESLCSTCSKGEQNLLLVMQVIISRMIIIKNSHLSSYWLNQYYHNRAFSFLFCYLSTRLSDKCLHIAGYKQEADHGSFCGRIWNRIVSDIQ